MNPEIQDLANGYVLGTLSATGRAHVERRLPHDPELQAAVAALEAKLLPLTQLAGEVEPSPRLWPRIAATLAFGQQHVREVVSWWNSLPLWRGLSFAGTTAALLLGLILFLQAPPQTKYVVVLAAPQNQTPGWVIQASHDNRLKLTPLGKLDVPVDKSLQFWTKGEGWNGPVSLGLVKPGESLEVMLDKLPPLQPNQLFEITLEPYAGSPIDRPTGPVLHIGRAVKVM